MADVGAFRGYRYDPAVAGPLVDLIAPPYDVIDSALQDRLYERNEHNVIRLELNRDQPGDSAQNNRYTRAAQFLNDCKREGALRQDSSRALYVYHQEYQAEGEMRIRRGFFARVRLEPFGSGRIFPHEETLAGPKADRLSLYRATRMNISPVFGLYPDETREVQDRIDQAVARALPLEARDDLGVLHRLWVLTDQAAASAVTGMMGPKPIFIADGHHRYETSLRYQAELKERGEAKDDQSAANFVLMALVGMSDPGLLIMPTHRLISGLPGLTAAELQNRLGSTLELELSGFGSAGAKAAWDRIQADGSQRVLAFGIASDGSWHLARYRGDDAIMNRLAPEHSPRWRQLAVSVLHLHVLGECLPAASAATHSISYFHQVDEIVDALAAKSGQLGVLVPAATMDDVIAIAGNHEKMPPKSTYFYPKLSSGLVFNPLT